MSQHATLGAATQDRKARLAQLKSLKRKQAEQETEAEDSSTPKTGSKRKSTSGSPEPNAINPYLSGRNYDPTTRGPKLGFEHAPDEGKVTLEQQANLIAEENKRQAANEDADKPLDLFKLQPKKPNWDLKRDLDQKLELLNVRTDNAIARIVRERIEKAQKAAQLERNAGTSKHQDKDGDGDAIGMDGVSLVEATREMEREEAEDERREREDEASP